MDIDPAEGLAVCQMTIGNLFILYSIDIYIFPNIVIVACLGHNRLSRGSNGWKVFCYLGGKIYIKIAFAALISRCWDFQMFCQYKF